MVKAGPKTIRRDGKTSVVLPAAVTNRKSRRKSRLASRTFWIGYALAGTVVVVLWLMFPRGERATTLPAATPPAVETQARERAEDLSGPSPGAVRTGRPAEIPPPVIAAAWVTPARPTRRDAIRANATLSGGGKDAAFSYRWKVNGREIEGAVEEALKGAPLKRMDRVSVVVRASRDGIDGPPCESPFVVIHGIIPTLEMEVPRSRWVPDQPIEIRLASEHPDDESVVFALVPPYVEGMTVDSHSGRLTWKPDRVLSGVVRFGASVTDGVGNRVTRTFDLMVGVETAAPSTSAGAPPVER